MLGPRVPHSEVADTIWRQMHAGVLDDQCQATSCWVSAIPLCRPDPYVISTVFARHACIHILLQTFFEGISGEIGENIQLCQNLWSQFPINRPSQICWGWSTTRSVGVLRTFESMTALIWYDLVEYTVCQIDWSIDFLNLLNLSETYCSEMQVHCTKQPAAVQSCFAGAQWPQWPQIPGATSSSSLSGWHHRLQGLGDLGDLWGTKWGHFFWGFLGKFMTTMVMIWSTMGMGYKQMWKMSCDGQSCESCLFYLFVSFGQLCLFSSCTLEASAPFARPIMKACWPCD